MIRWKSLLVILHVLAASIDANSSILPNYNFTMPDHCDPANKYPMLTWCKYNNPYILSDFLSRNSTDLTLPRKKGSPHFAVRWNCTKSTDPKDFGAKKCTAIKEIRTGFFGPVDQPESIRQYIMYTDLWGELLFVDFNNNTMAGVLRTNLLDITRFDVLQLYYKKDLVSYVDMVVLGANNLEGFMFLVDGRTGNYSEPCPIFDSPFFADEGSNLIQADFFPKSNYKLDVPLNFGWMWKHNITQYYKVRGETVPWYLKNVHSYSLWSVPATVDQCHEYLKSCVRKKPHENVLNIETLI
eukprot:gene15584-653_t